MVSGPAADALKRPDIPGPRPNQGTVNTNVVLVGGRIYAVVEAGDLPVELSYELESVGPGQARIPA